MDSEAIAELLLAYAPANILSTLELSRDNVMEWTKEVGEWGEFHRVETAALALYYSVLNRSRKPRYQGSVSVSLDVIHALVQLAKIEESGAVEGLMEEVAAERRAVVQEKKRATLAHTRTKIEAPTWYEKALELDARGLSASVIAKRVGKSASWVRRVLSRARK
ncbi:hypothetical protein IFR09_18305 [Pseudomonas syringae]|nr:hypothetical protein [Pseudomonas syringae]MBD8802389.1 hypothetical protein [Pseudomonas syringae]MBD8813117.1 hypothetical protein [Pseudomonas syringae]